MFLKMKISVAFLAEVCFISCGVTESNFSLHLTCNSTYLKCYCQVIVFLNGSGQKMTFDQYLVILDN